ncbi:MAG TPA: hypothetical protein VF950_07625 [Planctomycetota bacterium]
MIAFVLLLLQEPHRALSVEELAAVSPYSGVAVVERVGVRADPATGAVYTDAHLRVRETWGAPFPADVVLTQVGGELGGRRSAAVGWNYALSPGRTIAFFCKPWKGPYFAVTGMRQGLFHVDGGRATGEMESAGTLPLAELRARAGRTLGRELAPAVAAAEGKVPPSRAVAGSATEGEGPAERDVPPPPAPASPGRFFFALAVLLGVAALLFRGFRRR